MIRRKCIERNLSLERALEAFKKGKIIGKKSVSYRFFLDGPTLVEGLVFNGEDLLDEDWMILEEDKLNLPVSEEISRHLLPFNNFLFIPWRDLSLKTKEAIKKLAKEEREREEECD
jgi:hypothetical protein